MQIFSALSEDDSDLFRNPQEEDRIPTPPQTLNWEMSGITSSPMEQDHVYVNCCRDTGYILPDQRLVPDVEFARGGYNIAPYSPKITISDLLNPGPPSASPWQDGDRFSGTNNTHANIDEAGRATTICSTSSESISSSATLVPALSVAENHVFLVGDLYYTCRDAANSYISTLGPIHRHSSYCHRHHPYSPASCPGQHARLGRSPSLMDNISAICTHMWRKARRDVLAPRRAEAEAVRDMRDLYAWGETVSRAFQSDGLEENRMDWENAEGRRCSGVGSDVWARVGEAAKNLCKWLENNEALVSCEEAANGLRELKKEAGRSSPDEFGCIL